MQSGTNGEEKTASQYLIIGGAPKSATTSIFRYLADHPQVCPANRKETYFFAREFDHKKVCNSGETLQAFENYFTHCRALRQLRVEATPYTLYSKDAAQKIARLLPNATMLFVLRNPVERLLSDYRFHIQRGHPSTRGTFEEFVEWQLNMQGMPNLFEQGRYIEYLRPFFDAFERSNILIIFFEKFKTNPTAELQKLCTAMGIEPEFYSNYHYDTHNQTINIRYAWLNQVSISLEPTVANLRKYAMRNPAMHRMFENIINAGKKAYHTLNNRKSNNMATIPDKVRANLIDYYQPHNRALAKELGRSLPWQPPN